MTLKERIQDDFKASMRNKERTRKSVLTMLRAAIKQREIDERIELNDEAIIQIISKQIKQKSSAIADFEKGNRLDLVELTNHEIAILKEYLPAQLTDKALDELIHLAVKEVGAVSMKDMGKVMSTVVPKINGRADGAIVSQKVKHLLNNNKA
jgi:uncharacterized protein YqeY